MIGTTIVPIIKNKCGNLADSNNYRPIAIATIVSKLFESVFYINARRSYTHVIISSDLNLSTVLKYVFTQLIVPKNVLLTIYNTLILPHINYCLLVWGSKSGKILQLQKKSNSSGLLCRIHFSYRTTI